ncbi:MAG: hypothetical protein ABFS43_02015 [Thermodesulfobacteriota bacterium]
MTKSARIASRTSDFEGVYQNSILIAPSSESPQYVEAKNNDDIRHASALAMTAAFGGDAGAGIIFLAFSG